MCELKALGTEPVTAAESTKARLRLVKSQKCFDSKIPKLFLHFCKTTKSIYILIPVVVGTCSTKETWAMLFGYERKKSKAES